MAHRLSSSLYDDGNKMSKGQEMYLKRAKKAGKWVHGVSQQHLQHQRLAAGGNLAAFQTAQAGQ